MTDDFQRLGVAGRFFPADPDALSARVTALLAEARRRAVALPRPPQAVISPHAGYDFSGVLTAAALQATADRRPGRIAILSPAHRHAFRGIALPGHAGYLLPNGGRLAIDRVARDSLVRAGRAQILDAAHRLEHGIETQLPFLAALHPQVPILPLVIGQSEPGQVAHLLDHLAADGADTLFILSSDLSHFLSHDAAQARDEATAQKIERGDHGALATEDACGARGIAGFLASAAGRGARPLRLAMTNSAETSGNAARVVGYGTWTLHNAGDPMLNESLRGALLDLARRAIEAPRDSETPAPAPERFAPPMRGLAASFVTLEKAGRLRGCIGSLAPRAALVQDVARNARRAGFADPRFPALGRDEPGEIAIKISVLSRPAALPHGSEDAARAALVPGETGAILTDGRHRGVFLPQVWESLPTRGAFLEGLKRKAGLPADHWSDTLAIETFRAESFAETD